MVVRYRTDLMVFIQACDKCSSFAGSAAKKQGHLRPTVVGEPCDRFSIDLTGPHVNSNGYTYLLTCIDIFSMFFFAVSLRIFQKIIFQKIISDGYRVRFGFRFGLGLRSESSFLDCTHSTLKWELRLPEPVDNFCQWVHAPLTSNPGDAADSIGMLYLMASVYVSQCCRSVAKSVAEEEGVSCDRI